MSSLQSRQGSGQGEGPCSEAPVRDSVTRTQSEHLTEGVTKAQQPAAGYCMSMFHLADVGAEAVALTPPEHRAAKPWPSDSQPARSHRKQRLNGQQGQAQLKRWALCIDNKQGEKRIENREWRGSQSPLPPSFCPPLPTPERPDCVVLSPPGMVAGGSP